MYDLQRASMWKRISACLFDGILLAIVSVLFAYLISVACSYDRYAAVIKEKYEVYGQEYGVDLNMPYADFESMSDETRNLLEKANQALSNDEEAVYAYGMMTQLTLLITTFGILMGFIVMEFTVPMLLGNGQTLGKKIFGIAVMTKEGVRLNGKTLFARTILGKYAIETMIPVYVLIMVFFGTIGIIAPVILIALAVTEIALLIATYEHSAIHDKIASTVAVDMGSQLIFESREELIAYKEEAHREKVRNTTY